MGQKDESVEGENSSVQLRAQQLQPVRMFSISKGEMEKAVAWSKAHHDHCPHRNDPQGAAWVSLYTYCFLSTGIGDACSIRCKCGASKDITDYKRW